MKKVLIMMIFIKNQFNGKKIMIKNYKMKERKKKKKTLKNVTFIL